MKPVIIEFNAVYLLIGSLICQLLTIFNGWLKKKTDLLLRLGFQFGLTILGIILIKLSGDNYLFEIKPFLLLVVLIYFITVIIGIFSMLIDSIVAKQYVHKFDFNNYSRIAILLGLLIGSGIYFNFSLTFH